MSTKKLGITESLLLISENPDDSNGAREDLWDAVYDELRVIAKRLMSSERVEHTLQPTALVHEAYFRLVDHTRVEWQNRAQFFAISARVMRRLLVDHARGKSRQKRAGGWDRVTLDESVGVDAPPVLELIALDHALDKLEEMSERMSRVVELRIFAGLTMREAAHVLGVSKRTADDDWRVARQWLTRELSSETL